MTESVPITILQRERAEAERSLANTREMTAEAIRAGNAAEVQLQKAIDELAELDEAIMLLSDARAQSEGPA